MVSKARKRKYVPVVILTMVPSVIGVGAFALVRNFLHSAPNTPKPVVQQVQLIRPPPPPPDLPPPPPPPPEEKVDIPQPEKQPDQTPSNEPPPSEQLGLDAQGGAGSDAFGLAARAGGRDITATGGSAFAWYANQVKDAVLSMLSEDKRIRSGSYRVAVRVWVNEDGSVQRTEIVRGSGDSSRDSAIATDLQQVKQLAQPPPAGMPGLINLEINSRG